MRKGVREGSLLRINELVHTVLILDLGWLIQGECFLESCTLTLEILRGKTGLGDSKSLNTHWAAHSHSKETERLLLAIWDSVIVHHLPTTLSLGA